MSFNSASNFENAWTQINSAIEKIFDRNNEKMGATVDVITKLYQLTYTQCTVIDKGAELSRPLRMYERFSDFFQKQAKEFKSLSDNYDQVNLICHYIKEWERYSFLCGIVDDICLYFNKNCVLKEKANKPDILQIYQLSVFNWRKFYFEQVKDRILPCIFELVKDERDGKFFDNNIIKNLVDNINVLELEDEPLSYYNHLFGNDYISQTDTYYQVESSKNFRDLNISQYLEQVEKRLCEEEKRLENYVPPSLHLGIINNLEKIMITTFIEDLSLEFSKFVDNDKMKDIQRLYTLLNRVPNGHTLLLQLFEEKICNEGKIVIEKFETDVKNDAKFFIEGMISICVKYESLVRDNIKNDPNFLHSLVKSCRRIINSTNKRKVRTAELLATYIDSILKKGSKIVNDSDIDNVLDNTIIVFNYLEDKDVFMYFYTKHLSLRLIQDNSLTEEAEQSMIYKIKNVAGSSYISKLERMISDMTLNKSLDEDFQYYCTKLDAPANCLTVKVLSAGFWPFSQSSQLLQLPSILSEKEVFFNTFYNSKYSGRKLNYLHQYSKGEIVNATDFKSMVGKQQAYTFQCTTFQIAVLLLFNKDNIVKYEQISKTTQIPASTLTTVIKSLLACKLLLIDPKLTEENNTISSAHRFMINKNFRNPRIKLSIASKAVDAEKESAESNKTIQEDRSLYIQAAIVRIMKMRKELTHINLVSEVIPQLQSRFKPIVSDIKKALDHLIAKEYLERANMDGKNNNGYR